MSYRIANAYIQYWRIANPPEQNPPERGTECVTIKRSGFLTREKTCRNTAQLVFSRVRKPTTTRCVFPLPMLTHPLLLFFML